MKNPLIGYQEAWLFGNVMARKACPKTRSACRAHQTKKPAGEEPAGAFYPVSGFISP
jgi:hypothetical protein